MSTPWSSDALVRDSATLVSLQEMARRELPAGWRAEITPDVDRGIGIPWRTGDSPCLVVWREALTPAEILAPGASWKPDYQPRRVCYQLTLTPYYSLAEYLQAARENIARNRRRAEFVVRIPGMPRAGSYKGSFPPNPEELALLLGSLTPEQSELVRQYSLLWSRTELVILPSHYFGSLSLLVERDSFRFQDAAVEQECEEVWNSLQALITPYPAVGEN